MKPQLKAEYIHMLEVMGNASLAMGKNFSNQDINIVNQAITSLAGRQAEICNILIQLLKERK